MQKIFISYEADTSIKEEQASIANEVSEVSRLAQAIDKANEIFKSWAITTGGDIISFAGPYGRIALSPESLEDLPKMQKRYSDSIEGYVSVGVGLTLREADKALAVSKIRGNDKIVFYTPDLEEEFQQDREIDQSFEDKFLGDLLGKAEHPFQNQFEQIIQEREDAEVAKQAESERNTQIGQTKQAVVQILQQVRANSKELEKLKDEAPHLYDSIQKLIQGLIMLGRELQSPQQLAKSEEIKKAVQPVKAKHHIMNYPVGFALPTGPGTHGKRGGGRIKVIKSNGRTKWVSVRSGMVLSPDGVVASSRHPSGGGAE